MKDNRLISIVALLTAATLAAAVAQADDPAPAARVTPPTVYLRGELDLEKLKEANPDHYARAQRIMADAEEICKPGPNELRYVAAENVRCQGMVLKTSYPAKREIGFTLDSVRYVALVVVKDGDAQFRRVPGALDPAH
jgi:hypothetical protein